MVMLPCIIVRYRTVSCRTMMRPSRLQGAQPPSCCAARHARACAAARRAARSSAGDSPAMARGDVGGMAREQRPRSAPGPAAVSSTRTARRSAASRTRRTRPRALQLVDHIGHVAGAGQHLAAEFAMRQRRPCAAAPPARRAGSASGRARPAAARRAPAPRGWPASASHRRGRPPRPPDHRRRTRHRFIMHGQVGVLQHVAGDAAEDELAQPRNANRRPCTAGRRRNRAPPSAARRRPRARPGGTWRARPAMPCSAR